MNRALDYVITVNLALSLVWLAFGSLASARKHASSLASRTLGALYSFLGTLSLLAWAIVARHKQGQ
jgi:hypothetical protein